MSKPLRILMSQQSMDRLGASVSAAMGEHPYALITLETAVGAQRTDADVAFISREVTGTSTKHEIHPALQQVYTLLRQSPALRWVHIHSAGADRQIYLDLMAKGIQVCTSSGANAQVVATVALAGMLALARRFPLLWAEQQQRQWIPMMGERMPRDLPGQTATIVGWGPIGQKLGSLLQALGVNVVAVRQQAQAKSLAQSTAQPDATSLQMVTFEEWQQVLPQTDWLVLACPLTSKTRQLVNAQALALMPPGAHLVNVARGEVVDEPALVAALQSGQLGGAFLDVFAHEPLPKDSPLWAMPQVMVTPHAAGHSDGNETRVAKMFLDNLSRWVKGQPLRNAVG
ncbi:D-2-hydroxyacid dehydrogenase [Limnohabitans sp. Rim8]|uniref:D-2-hydroxyacid dehydrogenase n=1 Tax=Limnohabitans sp. Rim8 TaxID=1100718 RepID=UPI002607D0D0|nr:D-2-hydroxyacid dehydrogenase [Limnohabitans sp. Rim8]